MQNKKTKGLVIKGDALLTGLELLKFGSEVSLLASAINEALRTTPTFTKKDPSIGKFQEGNRLGELRWLSRILLQTTGKLRGSP